MHFEDVFGLDADDCTSAFIMPRMLDTTPNPFLPLTPEKEDVWASISGLEYAISPTETGSFVDGAVGFSNRGLGEFEGSTNRDVAWAGRQVSEEIWGLEEMRINLDNFYTWLLRFSIDCPFKDVRKGCREILKRAEVNPYSSLLSSSIKRLPWVVWARSKCSTLLAENRGTNTRSAYQRTLIFHSAGRNYWSQLRALDSRYPKPKVSEPF